MISVIFCDPPDRGQSTTRSKKGTPTKIQKQSDKSETNDEKKAITQVVILSSRSHYLHKVTTRRRLSTIKGYCRVTPEENDTTRYMVLGGVFLKRKID